MSNPRQLAAVAFLVAGAFILGQSPRAWTQEAPTRPMKIGVINLKEVFTRSDKAKLFEEQLDREKKAEEASIQELEKSMKALMAQIDEIGKQGKESELLKQYREQLVTMEALRRYRAESWNDIVKDRINKNTAELYNDIRAIIDTFAAMNGYDLVLKTEAPKLETDTEESANQRIARRAVLYANRNFEITEQIITELNRPK